MPVEVGALVDRQDNVLHASLYKAISTRPRYRAEDNGLQTYLDKRLDLVEDYATRTDGINTCVVQTRRKAPSSVAELTHGLVCKLDQGLHGR